MQAGGGPLGGLQALIRYEQHAVLQPWLIAQVELHCHLLCRPTLVLEAMQHQIDVRRSTSHHTLSSCFDRLGCRSTLSRTGLA